jgi:hypothetical protein
MPPEDRERVLNSDRFKGTLNEQERSIVSSLLESNIDLDNRPENPAPPK